VAGHGRLCPTLEGLRADDAAPVGPAIEEANEVARGIPRAVVDMLQAVPLLSACNKHELRQVAGLGTPVTVRDGTHLTEQGKPGYEFFLLVSGKAVCLVDGRPAAHFGPGDFFGEMALLEHGPRHATVVVEGDAEVIVLDGREFDGLLAASPTITRKLLSALAQRQVANVHS
jgi:CRP/FNR family transcriptional regulator, cyclic AMP receptor protein